jgi:molybdenum cofactor biosynthesis enzyme MoaA
MGFPPWKDICINCQLFNSGELFTDNLTNKQIKMIQIETSLNCSLSCPCCMHSNEIKQRPGPYLMDLKVFKRVLKSCVESGFKVENIIFMGNGEPLSHPNFSDFVELAHSIIPETKLTMHTNGNYDYKKSLKDQYLDEIFVSCDGLYQSSYEKYRIHGSVSQALKFMADAKSSKHPNVIWKYTLFEFNDQMKNWYQRKKRL